MAAPVSVSDRLTDRIVGHTVNLMRFEEGQRRRVLRMLGKLQKQLIVDIARIDPTAPGRDKWRLLRLRALLQQSEATIRTAYSEINGALAPELVEVAQLEQSFLVNGINATVGANIASVALSGPMLKSLAGNTLIEGAPAKEWWRRQAVGLQQSFSDQMRLGVMKGEGIAELARRIRGRGEEPGLIDIKRRPAEMLVRGSVMAVANEARLETMRENSDIVKGLQAVATLDSRTSPICRARDGSAWDIETGEPFPGHPPWHIGCRTSLVPVVKSAAELRGRARDQVRQLPAGTRASMDGQVSAKLTYEDWLKTKPTTFQREVLGRGRWELWRRGKLPLHQMVSQAGRPYKLSELREAA